MRKNIFAYTPPGFNPSFFSLNEENGRVTVNIRGLVEPLSAERREELLTTISVAGDVQTQSAIDLPLKQLVMLSSKLTGYLFDAVNKLTPDERAALLAECQKEMKQ